MASAGQKSPSNGLVPTPAAGGPPLLCGYCAKHKFAVTAAFLAKSAAHCKSCGVDTEKENKKAAAAQAAAAQRGAAWGVALPLDFAAASGLSASPTARGRRTSHAPTVQGAWLPPWLRAAAASRGVRFDDPADPTKTPAAASAEVASLWRRAMPRSPGCWDIDIAFRCVVFDAATGAAAGACYFDPRNKYVPCVAVDGPFRRRGLGSLLVVAAVAVIESVNATVKADGAGGAHGGTGGSGGGSNPGGSNGNGSGGVLPGLLSGVRPHLCVSPKDLNGSPHLHAFYTKLGFAGGRLDRGGNYALAEADASALLAAFAGGGGGGAGAAAGAPAAVGKLAPPAAAPAEASPAVTASNAAVAEPAAEPGMDPAPAANVPPQEPAVAATVPPPVPEANAAPAAAPVAEAPTPELEKAAEAGEQPDAEAASPPPPVVASEGEGTKKKKKGKGKKK